MALTSVLAWSLLGGNDMTRELYHRTAVRTVGYRVGNLAADGVHNGASIDMRGFQSCMVAAAVVSGGASNKIGTFKLQHSDDGAVWTDAVGNERVGDVDAQSLPNGKVIRLAYVGNKRYCRMVLTVGAVALVAADVMVYTAVLGHARYGQSPS